MSTADDIQINEAMPARDGEREREIIAAIDNATPHLNEALAAIQGVWLPGVNKRLMQALKNLWWERQKAQWEIDQLEAIQNASESES